MLNIHELNVFVEAAEVQNFSIAAHRLYLSQPAVSLQIRNLEKQLGVELFRRNGRNVVLSDAGKVLLPLAKDLLRQARHVEEVMWGIQGMVIGELIIACSASIGEYMLPRLVAGFRRICPEVRVSVSVVDPRSAVDSLLDGRADLAIVSAPNTHRDLETHCLLDDELILVVPPDHPWAQRQDLAPADLRGASFILGGSQSSSYETLAQGLLEHGLSIADLKTVMSLGNAEAMAFAVEEGIGAAFISRLVATRGLSLGCIVEVPVSGLTLAENIYLARQVRRALTPPQQTFWEFALDPAGGTTDTNPAASFHRSPAHSQG